MQIAKRAKVLQPLAPRQQMIALLGHWGSVARQKKELPYCHPMDARAWPPRAGLVNHAGMPPMDLDTRWKNCQSDPTSIDESLVPTPYIGSMLLARVVILMDAPGIQEGDHAAEDIGSEMRLIKTRSLPQFFSNPSFSPFYPLDESFEQTPAGQQWRGLGEHQFGWDAVMAGLATRCCVSVRSVQHCLAHEMAVLYGSPYRSLAAHPQSLFNLPSSRLAKATAKELLGEARTGDRILLLASTHGRFGSIFGGYEKASPGWSHRHIWCARNVGAAFKGFHHERSLIDHLSELLERRLKHIDRLIQALG